MPPKLDRQALRWGLLALLLPWAFALAGQQNISFIAEVDKPQVAKDSYLELRFVLTNAEGEALKLPDFKGFNLVSGINTITSASIINGRISKQQVHSLFLQPTKSGRLSIGSASIKVGKKEYRSAPISIEVLESGSALPPNAVDGLADLGDKVFVRAEISTTQAWLGQQIILDYRLFSQLEITSFNILSEHEYEHFFARDLLRYDALLQNQRINGKVYSSRLLKRIALYPQQAGTFRIKPLSMQLGVNIPSPGRPNSFMPYRTIPFNVETEEIIMTVRPLPPGAPPGFSGAVGDYEATFATGRVHISTDDAVPVQLIIRGTGDNKRVQAPDLALGEHFEVYSPRLRGENSQEREGLFIGEKVFEYLVQAQDTGAFTLVPAFSYFDPQREQYVSLLEDTLRFQVSAGSGQVDSSGWSSAKDLEDSDIRPIATAASFYKKRTSLLRYPAYWLALGLPFLLLAAYWAWADRQRRRANMDPVLLRQQNAKKMALRRLSKARQHMQQKAVRDFYDELSRALYGYVADKLQLPAATLGKAQARQALEASGASPAHVETFFALLAECERALFAAAQDPDMAGSHERAARLMSALEGELG